MQRYALTLLPTSHLAFGMDSAACALGRLLTSFRLLGLLRNIWIDDLKKHI
jgi:hypothetical protein